MPYSVYKQLGLGELKPTNITLSLADRSVKIPKGIVEDVLVKVDKFYYLVDFVVLDTEPVAGGTNQVPIILGRPFLATYNAIISCRNGVMHLNFGNMTLKLNIFHLGSKHKSAEEQEQELMKISEAVDEELTASVIPLAPPKGRVLKIEEQKLNSDVGHLTTDMEGLLLLDPP